MTTQAAATAHLPTAATAVLVGWFASGGVTPHYNAVGQDWVNCAHDNQWKGRISAFAMLLAAFTFLYFMSAIQQVLASAESRIRGSAPLGRVAFAGALTGIAGMAMAVGTMAAASSDGGNVDPAVTKAVTTERPGHTWSPQWDSSHS